MSAPAASLPFDCGLPPAQRFAIEELWKDGVVRVRELLSPQDTVALGEECSRLMQEQPRVPFHDKTKYGLRYRLPIYFDTDWSVLSNVVGLSRRVDEVLERLFTNADLVPLLRAILGTGYKLWELSIRRSERTDSGLRMHQDAEGEFGMAVLLQDVPERGGGGTAFITGSHRFPVSSRDAGMTYINPKYLKRWTRQTAGVAGDVFLFCKSIWHGRLPTDRAVPHDMILLSFFAAGYEFTPFEVPPELVATLPPELKRLLEVASGATRLPDGRLRVGDGQTQQPRLIDALYAIPRARPHPAHLLRLLPPLFRIALPVKRALRI